MNKTEIRKKYQVDIGIECHVQLKTKSKLFCGCGNDAREAEPNTLICEICLGFPGTLPYLNEQAVWLSLRAGLALNAKIPSITKFDRKNYFYPDLPKGYQITQFDQPIVGQGHVDVPLGDGSFKVGITRAHMEEDAGKLVHPPAKDYSLVDLNRAGTPLLEIVSEPDIHSPAEAKAYVQELYNLMRFADVSEVNLYYGNMRFDVNTSVRLKDSKKLGTRTETKNINSFRNVERAAEFEIERQIVLLEKGEKITQETRGWDDAKGKTTSQRSKEEAEDYRYFPEPDLPPLRITGDIIEKAKSAQLLSLRAIRDKLANTGLRPDEVEEFISIGPGFVSIYLADLLPKASQRAASLIGRSWIGATEEAIDELIKQLHSTAKKRIIDELALAAEATIKGELTNNQFRNYSYEQMLGKKPTMPKAQISDTSEVEKIIELVIGRNQKAVTDYQNGNENSLKFLIGQVMKDSQGQVNPSVAADLLHKKLK